MKLKCEGKLYINCFLIGYNKSSDDKERKEGRRATEGGSESIEKSKQLNQSK